MRRAMVERWRQLAGHAWTMLPEVSDRVRPVVAPSGCAWETVSSGHGDDGDDGDTARADRVMVRGSLARVPDASTLLLVVHGLGGDPQSPYCRRAARDAAARGWSCLRLAMRGSLGDGEDLYHAGLDADLAAALDDPALAGPERVLVLGYSLGGHLSLRHGLTPHSRVTAIAAVSAPLDLERSCRAIDRRRQWIYRTHILRSLKEGYRRVAARRPVPTPVEQVDRIRTLREWDRLTVVPRFGFADVDDYYRTASVGPRLHELRVPALYVGMEYDPMIPTWTVRPSLDRSLPRLQQRWLGTGGHVAAPGGWETDVLDWLDRVGR